MSDDIRIALQQQPGHLIRRAHQTAVSRFYEVLGREVTPIQYALLLVLQDKPGIDQVTLALEVGLDTSTTADTAVRLEAKGWIVRELLARGQRSLSLTADGEAVLRERAAGLHDLQRLLFSHFDAAEQAEFMRLLRKFAGASSPDGTRADDATLARNGAATPSRKRRAR